MKKNSGRSETLHPRPEREYLLKGIIRCAYCGMPMWAQTYQSGNRHYREHIESRAIAPCSAHCGYIHCQAADEQAGKLIEAIELGPRWLEEVLADFVSNSQAYTSPDPFVGAKTHLVPQSDHYEGTARNAPCLKYKRCHGR